MGKQQIKHALQPLAASDFAQAPNLTLAFLRRLEPWLTDAAFGEDLEAIRKLGIGKFLRSFPIGYWADLAQIEPKRCPGTLGACLGDAHFNNFGFVLPSGRKRFLYAFDDLDDGGWGLVALDALKYFTILGADEVLKDLLPETLATYLRVLKRSACQVALPKRLVPKPKAILAKKLEKVLDQGRIRIDGVAFTPFSVNSDELQAVTAALRPLPEVGPFKLLEVQGFQKLAGGGSAGAPRYWALIQREASATMDLIEFKTMLPPGTEYGQQGQKPVLTQRQRVQFLKKRLWGIPREQGTVVTRIGQQDYLARNRFHHCSLSPLEARDEKDRARILQAQVSLMADLHREAFKGVPTKALRCWLLGSASHLQARWAALVATLPCPAPAPVAK